MNLRYVKIGIPLALIGGILGIITFVLTLPNPPSFFASFFASQTANILRVSLGYLSLPASVIIFAQLFAPLRTDITYFVFVGYLSLAASVIIVVLILALFAKKLLKYINTVPTLVIILGVLEAENVFGFLNLGILGGALAVIGGILAWVGLKPEKEAKPAKEAKAKAKEAKARKAK